MLVICIRDSRVKHSKAEQVEEQLLLDDDEVLPPYEAAPPAYVAELSAESDTVLSNQTDIKITPSAPPGR